jgi:hypothetical protein
MTITGNTGQPEIPLQDKIIPNVQGQEIPGSYNFLHNQIFENFKQISSEKAALFYYQTIDRIEFRERLIIRLAVLAQDFLVSSGSIVALVSTRQLCTRLNYCISEHMYKIAACNIHRKHRKLGSETGFTYKVCHFS